MSTTFATGTTPDRNLSARANGYDLVILAAAFHAEGVKDGTTGTHYNYRTQAWVPGHDHAHADSACTLPPAFCGADVATCQGLEA